ncbi:MAG: ComF family protein [Elusimicrobiota bacterium]|nr:ComF family protein [Endomicrobiia bacterium]MDW8165839.1 ComF family protein [Elusimicrobiota bacterium]
MKKIFQNFFKVFFYILFPKICFHCEKNLEYNSNDFLCNECLNKIKLINGLVCKKCGVPLESGGEFCYQCKNSKRKIYFDFICGCAEYKEPIKTLIHEFKYRQRYYLKKYLVDNFLIKWWEKNKNSLPKIDIVCCVPMHFLKKLFRGYNQSQLLASEFAKKINLDFKFDLLIKKKLTTSQFKLSKEKRIFNIKDAFMVNKEYLDKIKDKNILIIDDVATTTETINQCAKVLKEAKANLVFGLVIARDSL